MNDGGWGLITGACAGRFSLASAHVPGGFLS